MDTPVRNETIRLTRLSHGGGCGCKVPPAALTDILASLPHDRIDPALLVGAETSDDAAVYRINATQAIVATTDFFMPIVDDPHDFGRIAAANALSDIYAMGARPLLALAIVGMPLGKLPTEAIRRILAGGAAVCREAGITVAGGHSIDAIEPIYGLAVLGEIHPDRIKRNDTARRGDAIILGKPLGVGILSAALKKGALPEDAYRQLISITTRLNRVGSELAGLDTVHAMTDVTGFGLLGHLAELCRGARHGARIAFDALPVIPAALSLAQQGFTTGAAARNWSSCCDMVRLQTDLAPWQQTLLCDPQTSGGLLVTCAPDAVSEVLSLFWENGFAAAAAIGSILPGEVAIHVDRTAGIAMDAR